MSESEQHWDGLAGALTQDQALARFAQDGALLLFAPDGARLLFANAAGRAVLKGRPDSSALPAATRERLRLLAGGLASPVTLRLERLRLASGLGGLVTCACRLVGTGAGPALAVGIAAAELRRGGIAMPMETEAAVPAVPPAQAAADDEATPEAATEPTARPPRRANLRFLWESDADGTIVSLSPDFADLVGTEAAETARGRNWSDLLADVVADLDGDLAERLATSGTWSGRPVLWRTGPGEGARVELSGFPLFDAGRNHAGFRGFGLVRSPENEPFPERTAAAEYTVSAAEPVADEAAVPGPADEAPVADSAAQTEAGRAPVDLAAAEARAQAGTATELPVAAAQAPEEVVDAEDRELAPAPIPASSAAGDDPSGMTGPDDTAAEQELAAELAAEAEEIAARVAALRLEGQAEQAQPQPGPPAPGNVVPLRNGHLTAVRPVLEPSKTLLSSAERNAFREIAKALGARIAGEDETEPRLPAAAPLRVRREDAEAAGRSQDGGAQEGPAEAPAPPASAEGRPRVANAHAEILDRLPIAVLVNRDETALYANRTLLDLLDYADLDDLTSAGGVSRLIKGATRTGGGAMVLVDRKGGLISVDGRLSSVSWQGEPATLMAFRNGVPGGDLRMLTPEEAEEQELAAEFAAEEEEAASRVAALRLEGQANEARVAELTAMLDTATDGVVTVDGRGRILSLNRSAEALFGYDQREVTGELFTLLFAPESHSPALDYLDGLIGGGVASLMNDGREVVARVRQGGRIPLFMTMGRIAEGPDSKFCAVLRDITAWKKTEGELVEARKAAEKASAQKSDVLAKISHEIRTPLNAIIGFAEVMAEERFGPIDNERYKEYLRDIHQSGGYVISLVNDLLDLAKIEAGKLDLDFGSVSLNEIALSAVNLLQPEAQRNRVVLRSGLAPKLPPVVADERSLRQIVINLLSNAVKFTDAGGQVIVSTALGDQGEAILRVRDTGIGMDDDEIALALEPFRQVPTTRKSGGTGLGLPLTKALVEANRAALTITSVKTEGTLVEVTFPPQRVLAS